MTEKHTFQSIILKLQQFWDQRGYVIWQPYYTQVGAGTMNPATFLRVLGPEPWHVAYVEPSVRPDDARYGENPNRFQLHYQFQVIIKPDPGDPQELYLESLKAIGIDPRRHDIRFVEDNWAQPAISAWGLGWEVWLDGQEITQFTYFQQVGGVTLDPVAVELTYGLERILIALNNAGAIWGEPWAPGISYGEVRRHDEYEHSKHYFETADIERVRQMFAMFEAEAQACIDQGLVLPAHDYVLKCSHTFNILDTRGAIGVTERQAFFHRMRELSRQVAETYLEQRQAQEYPLLQEQKPVVRVQRAIPAVSDTALPFVLEIGVEELPPGDVTAALEQLQTRVPALLAELRLEHGNVSILGTPRRLAIQIEALSPRQSDLEEIVKGPPAARAYDADGNPTPAALGFARGKGVDVADLQAREMDGGQYVAAIVRQAGRPTPEVLAEQLPKWIAAIKFEKSMRWNESGVAFARPIRWLVALLDEQVIPFEYAGVESGRTTRGLRPYDSPAIEVRSAKMYAASLAAAGVLLDPQERQAEILTQIKAAAAQAGGEVLIAPDLLEEVTHLVEKPTALLGNFDPSFLNLPEAVLISTMKKHQRYFPVKRGEKLLPHFIAVRNGDREHLEIVRQGNEHVLGARFADANYFVRQDLEQPLAAYRPKLDGLIFQSKLGSMLDKANRIEKLVHPLINALDLPADQATYARRGAHLCKADLVTQMVVEMTSLQGIIGAEYALRAGEAPEVAAALREHYQAVPQTLPGMAIALADRLDSLAGLFAAGLAPSGAKDPFGLRRAALGIVQPLIEHDIDLDLGAALLHAAELQPIPVGPEIQNQVLEFIMGRLRVLLTESGFRYDVVESVLAAQGTNPAGAARAVRALETWVARPDWEQILPAYARCVRITRDQSERFPLDPEMLCEPAESELLAALQTAQAGTRQPGSVDDFLKAFLPMIPAVNRFFDDVLVMVEDHQIRQNRLALLQQIAALAEAVADLSHLEGF